MFGLAVLAFAVVGAGFIILPGAIAFGRYLIACARRYIETP